MFFIFITFRRFGSVFKEIIDHPVFIQRSNLFCSKSKPVFGIDICTIFNEEFDEFDIIWKRSSFDFIEWLFESSYDDEFISLLLDTARRSGLNETK